MDTSVVSFITVNTDYAGQRIDNFLVARLKGVPKSRLYRLLRKGEIRVNKKRIKPDYRIRPEDVIRVPPIRTSAVKAAALTPNLERVLERSVLYEDDELMVINKPSGLAVHGGSGVSLGLIEALRQWRSSSQMELAHRLDRDTSGCILVAKKRSMLRYLQDCFRENKVDKVYRALVVGNWPKRLFQINKPLVKNQLANGERMVKVALADVAGAKPSLTKFAVIKAFAEATLMEAKPVTGRTHQIRVHCASAGCSIVGDDKYTSSENNKIFRGFGANRLFLHSFSVSVTLPDGRLLAQEAPLDDQWGAVTNQLRPL